MRQYEATYLISDNVSESEIVKVTGKIGGYISDRGGKILKEESWGRRKLIYPIKKQKFATYITAYFELKPENISKIEQKFKLAPEIIRYLLIVKDLGKDKLELNAFEVAETKEIEKVVGGEKSFEAVKGMTEKSKSLMAKRDKDIKTDKPKSQQTEEQDKIKAKKPAVKEKIKDETKKIGVEKPTIKTKKPTIKKKTVIKKESEKTKIAKKEDVKLKKSAKPKIIKKKETKVDQEVERIAKLDKELDDILGDDL